MRVVVVLVAAVMLLAGCASEPDEMAPEAAEPEIILGDRPDTTYTQVSTGPAVEPDWNATTAEAPRLVPGEWWRIRYEGAFSDELVEVVRVVAEVDDEGYIFGMPHEGWLKEAISFHSPAFGDVNFDLSYNTHNELFTPVKFPLVQGDSWETSFAASPMVATVEAADEKTATIVFTAPEQDPTPESMLFAMILGDQGEMRITYDATMHEVVRMESGLGLWEVVEHGYDYQGWVTVPRGEDTAIDYGVMGPASDSHTPTERTLTVADGFNRMTMMHFVGTVPGTPGHLEARDVTPGGEEWVTSMTGDGLNLMFYETNQPSGTWTVQDTVVGVGFTYHMGIAYFQYDIHLPTGDRRADHGHAVIR